MYCVIQEIKLKKADLKGNPKSIESYSWTAGGECYYSYKMSKERFDRKIKKAYKISIHHSYRENGKVKKKQWVICTMGYYSIVDYGFYIGDCCDLNKKLEAIGISEEELCDIVYKKLDPLIDKVKSEYEQTEEYKTTIHNKAIIKRHNKAEGEFNNKYGNGYNQCYDVFGELKNEIKLNQIIEDYKTRKEYEERSKQYQEEWYKRSYYNSSNSNHNNSSYSKNSSGNYTDEEKKLLKEAFKLLSHKHHPDKGGNNETMATINNLKEKIF